MFFGSSCNPEEERLCDKPTECLNRSQGATKVLSDSPGLVE